MALARGAQTFVLLALSYHPSRDMSSTGEAVHPEHLLATIAHALGIGTGGRRGMRQAVEVTRLGKGC